MSGPELRHHERLVAGRTQGVQRVRPRVRPGRLIRVELEHERRQVELLKASIVEDLPFAAFDVDLGQIGLLEVGKDVDGVDFVSAVPLDARARELAGDEGHAAVMRGRSSLDQAPAAAEAACVDAEAGHFGIGRVRFEGGDLRARKPVESPEAEETDVGAQIDHDRRPPDAFEEARDGLRDVVLTGVEDLAEDERVFRVVADEDRPSRPAEAVPLRAAAAGELAVHEPDRAPNGRRLHQRLGHPRRPTTPEDPLRRLRAGDPLDELPDPHSTALGRTEPALLSGAVTAGRPTLMHLAVNAMFLEPRMGGIETYVRELYPAIIEARPELRISMFVNQRGRDLVAAEPWSDSVQLVTHPLLGTRGMRALGEALLLDAMARRRRCQLLHSVALTAPLRPQIPSVVMVADVTWLREPAAVPRLTRILWKSLVIPAARRARRLIAISESAREEIAEDFRVPMERIDVIPLGPGSNRTVDPTPEQELRARLGLGSGPVILAVSGFRSHKNVMGLVEAMPAIRAALPDAALVLPGNWTPLQDEVRERARALGIDGALVTPGWVDAADLEGLFRTAACFVLPSRREGFGLPVLEAMRRGVPVACSKTSAVPEVAGDAALFFDPERHEEIAGAVTAILEDPALATDLAEKGQARAALFTWRRAAEKTLETFERALA